MTPQPTYAQLREHFMAMPICKSVKVMVIAMTQKCEALGMTVKECCDMIANACDEQQEQPKPIENGGNGYHKNYSEFLVDGANVLWFKKEKGNCCDGFTDLISVHGKN